ncbi:hypothetical protein [Dialister invisus]|uniref:hypothetical protein n=1 Tax=Dialister invisus TaxID=218538 RepID=UPI003AF62909
MEKKKIVTVACVVVAVCTLLLYFIFSDTAGNGNGDDAKDAVQEVQVHSKHRLRLSEMEIKLN